MSELKEDLTEKIIKYKEQIEKPLLFFFFLFLISLKVIFVY